MERQAGRIVAAHHADTGDIQGRANLERDCQHQFRIDGDRLWIARLVLRNRYLFLGGVLQGAAKAGICPASFHPLRAGQGRRRPGHGDHDHHFRHLRQRRVGVHEQHRRRRRGFRHFTGGDRQRH